jgi:hypothetical protein
VFFVKILFAVLAIPVIILVFAGIVFAIYLKLRKSGPKNKTKPKEVKATPVQKEVTLEKKVGGGEKPAGSVWGFFGPVLKFAFVVVIIWVGWGAYKHFSPSGSIWPVSQTTSSTYDSFQDIPAEIALPIICGCESSGIPGVVKQFEDDGITPLKNKPKPGEKASTAIGGCQIRTDLHEKRALDKFHLEIKTPEGNMAYAKILYNESTPHTKHWEGTPGNTTKQCWAPVLASLTRGQRTDEFIVYVEAPVGQFGDEVNIAEGTYFNWRWSDEGGAAFIIQDQKGATATYDPEKNVFEKLPPPSSRIKFKSLGEKPVTVKLKLARHPVANVG